MGLDIPKTRLLEYAFQRKINVGIWPLSFACHDGERAGVRKRLGVTAVFASAGLL
jgi:hypothetical protein